MGGFLATCARISVLPFMIFSPQTNDKNERQVYTEKEGRNARSGKMGLKMREKSLDFHPELLWGKGSSFSDIEERALAYRKIYMQDETKGRNQGKKSRQDQAIERTLGGQEESDRERNCRERDFQPRPSGGQREQPGQHYTESRIMEGDFATLLCLYGREGEEHSISRQGRHLTYYGLPRQGKYHKHEYIEVFYVIEGSFEQILLGEKRHFSKGEVVITDQNCEHADYIEKMDAAVLFLWLKPTFLDGLLKSYEERDDLHRFLFHALDRQKREQSFLELKAQKDAQGMGALLEQLVAEDYGRRPGAEEIIRGNLIRLFYLLCTSYALQLHSSDQESKERVLLYELERYIRLHAAEVTEAELEESFHYHRNYYNLLLKKYKGKSFREYVQEIRIQRAKELLLSTKLPLKQIAAQVGYENTSFFYQLFKRMTGISAGEFRKEGNFS